MGSPCFPEDIIEDILAKLPVKSIIRFQSVSKSWFDLIKSSRFISKHQIVSEENFLAMFLIDPSSLQVGSSLFLPTGSSRNREINICDSKKENAVYILSGYKYNFELFPSDKFFRYLEGDRHWHMAGDCNGILCMTNDKNIMVVNPSRKEVKLLPIPILPEVRDPREYWICRLVGFGFDNMSNFTVVRVLCFHDLRGVVVGGRVEVYNLKSNVWRELDEFPLSVLCGYSMNRSTFFNGVIHWCGGKNESGPEILTFNMADNLFSHLGLPQGWYETWKYRYTFGLFVLSQEESLAFVSYPRRYNASIGLVNVWTMNKEGIEATWTKLYSIGPLTKLERPLSFWNKHKFIYRTTDKKLILYDLLNHNRSVLADVSKIQLYDDARFNVCLEFEVCRPNLVSINM